MVPSPATRGMAISGGGVGIAGGASWRPVEPPRDLHSTFSMIAFLDRDQAMSRHSGRPSPACRNRGVISLLPSSGMKTWRRTSHASLGVIRPLRSS